MTPPGWNSLDSVKHVSDVIQILTLCCWSFLVVFDALAHFWKNRASTFTALAFLAFAAAVIGEVGNYEYGGRKEALHDAAEETLRADAAKAGDKAAKAQAELDRINVQMKQREVTPSQRKLLISTLSPFKGTTVTMIYMLTGGEETQMYAQEIADALRAAGWTVGMNAGSHEGPPRYDLTVVVNDKQHPHPATVLLDALKRANFPEVEGEADPRLPIETFEIVVRAKRPIEEGLSTAPAR